MRQQKFKQYEKVRVVGNLPELASVKGKVGIIMAALVNPFNNDEFVGEYILWFEGDYERWEKSDGEEDVGLIVEENCLETTGEFDCELHSKMYDGTTIKVGVDEEGFGFLIEDEDEEGDSAVDDGDEQLYA